jgi:acetyl-CoA carboxylase carboxyl transferase subunit beta
MGRYTSEVPEDLWKKCPRCDQMIFHRELQENLQVCTHCSYHMRISVAERFDVLFDDMQYQMIQLPEAKDDPLKFKDSKRYTDRLLEYRTKTKQNDAITVALGKIEGKEALIAIMNFEFMGGSMGVFVGHAFYAAHKIALERAIPLITITASGGARMQEGILSLMQMPTTVIAVEKMHEAKIILCQLDRMIKYFNRSISLLGIFISFEISSITILFTIN